jgi:pimeloyl-ACP methyl ester carboxylesterase
VEADGVRIFYRSAGEAAAPVLLLLHGFPTSSFMFRDLIPRLADQYRVIAPDLPGFGFTEVPEARKYAYSFDSLANTIDAFTDALDLNRYAIYVFDYGAPTGFRLAMRHPERVTAIISQNGNAYEEGLGDAWGPIRKYWSQPSAENREVIRQNILTLEGTRWQYTHGVASPDSVAPESYTLDTALFERPGFRSTFAKSSRLCWRSGAGTTRSSSPLVPKPIEKTSRTLKSSSWIRGTLPLKRMAWKSLLP